MDQIINYLLLTIIFVFDPLAISLVIAANYAFEQLKSKTKENIYGEKVSISKEEQKDLIVQMMKDDEKDGLYEELNSTLNDGLDEIKDSEEWEIEDEEKILEPNEFDIDKDGKLSAEEQFLKEQIEKLRADKSLGDFRIRREIDRLKQEFRKKHNLDDKDDLTIHY